jgi:hypothetical protein
VRDARCANAAIARFDHGGVDGGAVVNERRSTVRTSRAASSSVVTTSRGEATASPASPNHASRRPTTRSVSVSGGSAATTADKSRCASHQTTDGWEYGSDPRRPTTRSARRP